jgi:hypothetical protein
MLPKLSTWFFSSQRCPQKTCFPIADRDDMWFKMKEILFCVLVVVFVLSIISVTTTASPQVNCNPSASIAARRQLTEDGIISTSIYAGHRRKHMGAHVLWSNQSVNPQWGTFVVPEDDLVVKEDIPQGWFNGKSAITMERLLFTSQGRQYSWPVTSRGSGVNSTLLNLAPSSPLWMSHSAAVFTGQQIHFVPWRAGVSCSAADALNFYSPRKNHLTLWSGSPVPIPLSVYTSRGDLVATWNVTINSVLDMAQTLIPSVAIAELKGANEGRVLVLGHAVQILTSKESSEEYLAAPLVPTLSQVIEYKASATTTPEMMQVIFGRRLLQKLATEFAVDSHGHTALRFVTIAGVPDGDDNSESSSSGIDAVPLSVRWIAMVCGSILVFVSAYWSTQLGGTIQLGFNPDGIGRDVHIDKGLITGYDLLWGIIALALSVVAHVLMAIYAGHDTQADATLEQYLPQFSLSFWIPSFILGLLFLGILLIELSRFKYVRPGNHQYVSISLYAVLIGVVASRGVLAALLVTAGSTMLQLGVAILISLALVMFPCAYGTFFLAITLFSGSTLFRPLGKQRPWMVEFALDTCALFILTGLTVMLAISTSLWLIYPFLSLSNALYDDVIICAFTLFVVSLPLAPASLSFKMQADALVDRELKSMGFRTR